jgi:thiamine biosynthesis protein ThiS
VRVRVNGDWQDVPVLETVAALLDHFRIQHQAVGVLQNGQVVAREAFGQAPLQDGDELEIVRFVGGG